jgi:hypothetical protein
MRRPPSARFTPSTGRNGRCRRAMPEFAIIAVLVVVAGVGAAGVLGNAFGSSRTLATEHASDPPRHQVSNQITDRSKHQRVMGRDVDGRP